MTDGWTDDRLGTALMDLGAHVRTPEHSLWVRVRAELEASGPAGHRLVPARRGRLVVAVAAVVAVLLAVTLGVAPARRAVADFLGLGSTSVVRVERPPDAGLPSVADGLPPRADRRALRAELARAGLSLPAAELVGAPVGWRVDPDGETVVAFARLVFGQRPEGDVPAVKRVPPAGTVVSTTVGGEPASWVEGPHTRTVGGRSYRSASALLWTVDGVEYRLEGNLPLGSVRRVAETVAPV